MEEPKKGLMSKITPGNVIQLVLLFIGLTIAWAKMQSHMTDESLHVGPNEVVLTTEEYKNLLNFATTVKNEIGGVKGNTQKLIDIEKKDAVHFREFEFLWVEHDDLEGKVSRIYKELKDEIKN